MFYNADIFFFVILLMRHCPFAYLCNLLFFKSLVLTNTHNMYIYLSKKDILCFVEEQLIQWITVDGFLHITNWEWDFPEIYH